MSRVLRPSLILVAVVAVLTAACAGEDLGGEKLEPDAAVLGPASAQAMGAVTSVAFTVERTGAPVYIDAARSISLDRIDGRFSAPRSADAILGVTVNGSLGTKLGAVAIDDEVWMSNPVTGVLRLKNLAFDRTTGAVDTGMAHLDIETNRLAIQVRILYRLNGHYLPVRRANHGQRT